MKNNKWISMALILFAVAVVLGGTWLMAQRGTYLVMPGMMQASMPFDGWTMALMQIFMVVVFALCIAFFVLFITWLGRSTFGMLEPEPRRESPEEILQARFARGELSREQFQEMWQMLHT